MLGNKALITIVCFLGGAAGLLLLTQKKQDEKIVETGMGDKSSDGNPVVVNVHYDNNDKREGSKNEEFEEIPTNDIDRAGSGSSGSSGSGSEENSSRIEDETDDDSKNEFDGGQV